MCRRRGRWRARVRWSASAGGVGDVGGAAGVARPITTDAPTPAVPPDWPDCCPWPPTAAATCAAKLEASSPKVESNRFALSLTVEAAAAGSAGVNVAGDADPPEPPPEPPCEPLFPPELPPPWPDDPEPVPSPGAMA